MCTQCAIFEHFFERGCHVARRGLENFICRAAKPQMGEAPNDFPPLILTPRLKDRKKIVVQQNQDILGQLQVPSMVFDLLQILREKRTMYQRYMSELTKPASENNWSSKVRIQEEFKTIVAFDAKRPPFAVKKEGKKRSKGKGTAAKSAVAQAQAGEAPDGQAPQQHTGQNGRAKDVEMTPRAYFRFKLVQHHNADEEGRVQVVHPSVASIKITRSKVWEASFFVGERWVTPSARGKKDKEESDFWKSSSPPPAKERDLRCRKIWTSIRDRLENDKHQHENEYDKEMIDDAANLVEQTIVATKEFFLEYDEDKDNTVSELEFKKQMKLNSRKQQSRLNGIQKDHMLKLDRLESLAHGTVASICYQNNTNQRSLYDSSGISSAWDGLDLLGEDPHRGEESGTRNRPILGCVLSGGVDVVLQAYYRDNPSGCEAIQSSDSDKIDKIIHVLCHPSKTGQVARIIKVLRVICSVDTGKEIRPILGVQQIVLDAFRREVSSRRPPCFCSHGTHQIRLTSPTSPLKTPRT